MENNTPKQNSNNELDLWDVLKTFGNSVSNGLKASLRFFYRNFLWLSIFIILGGSIGYLTGTFSKKYYQSIILMQSKNINSSLVIREIDALNELFLHSKDKSALAEKLSMTEEHVSLIKSVTGIYAMDPNRDDYPDYADLSERFKKNPSDTAEKRMSDFFYLKMELYSKQIPVSLPISIKNFIGNNEFCKRENTFHLAQKQALLTELKGQLSLLDSLEKVDYFKNNTSSPKGEQLFMIGDRGRPLFHRDYIELYEKIQELELDLGLYSNDVIIIMQDTPQPSLIPQNSTKNYIIFAILCAFGLGVIALLFKENRKSIKLFFKN